MELGKTTSLLRAVEKEHMHTCKPPKINLENARFYCKSHAVYRLDSEVFVEEFAVYRFDGDLLYIPNPLKQQVKREIVHLALSTLLYPPYRTSIDRALDVEGLDLFSAYTEKVGRVMVKRREHAVAQMKFRKDPYSRDPEADAAAGAGVLAIDPLSLIQKIRWSSLGIYYDWEAKAYDRSIDAGIPKIIRDACLAVSREICQIDSFVPQTAIVNYYQQKDRIMSHVDRYEEDMAKPLVSFSFGCSAVFVVGGRDRDDPGVHTFLLQDGDIVVLLNESRYFHHGVPKILEENKGSYDPVFADLIGRSRINISVRQIYKPPGMPH